MITEIPLTCPNCRQPSLKSVEWVQENIFFTCEVCATAVTIDKDVATQTLAQLELAGRYRP
jgi:hypothetical protein